MKFYLILFFQFTLIQELLSRNHECNSNNNTNNDSRGGINSIKNFDSNSQSNQSSNYTRTTDNKFIDKKLFLNETIAKNKVEIMLNHKRHLKDSKENLFFQMKNGESFKNISRQKILEKIINTQKYKSISTKENFYDKKNSIMNSKDSLYYFKTKNNNESTKKFRETQHEIPKNLSTSLSANNDNNKIEKMIDLVTGVEDLCKFEDPEKMHSCVDLIINVFEFMRTNTNLDLISTYIIEDEDCSNDLMNLIANNYHNLSEIIQFSGKSLQDYGLEDNCISGNYSYYVTKFYIDDMSFFLKNRDLNLIYKFLGMESFQVGLCFVKNCSDYVESFFNETLNVPFFDYARNQGITNMRIFSSRKMETLSFNFIFYIYFLLAYLSWKLLCSFFGFFVKEKLGSRKNSQFSKDSLNNEVGMEDLDKEEAEYQRNKDGKRKIKKNKKRKNKNFFTKNEKNQSDVFSDEEESSEEGEDALSFGAFKANYLDYEKKLLENQEEIFLKDYSKPSKCFIFKKNCKRILKKSYRVIKKFIYYCYQFFAFNKDFWNLCEIKNCFYNDEKIEFISYYKLIILFLHTFNHIFYTAIILPHRDYFNLEYFTSIFFAIFKASNFSLDCYIVLEAAVTIYKLMCFLKKNDHQSFLSFFKFWIFCIPKVVVFLVIYFSFLIQFKNLGTLITSNTLFNKILIEKFRKKECFSENQFLIFNIFNFCLDLSNNMSFSKCFRVVHIYVNMFVCFSFFLAVFYFSMKFKNKVFDYTITFLIMSFCASNFFYFDLSSQTQSYTFDYIQGEIVGYKYIHMFAVKYFVGVLTGLFFFYSFETVLTNSVLNKQDYYMPFSYVYDYIVFINIKTKNKKKIKLLNLRISTDNSNRSPLRTSKNNSVDIIEENNNPNDNSINIPNTNQENNIEYKIQNNNNNKNNNADKSNSNNSNENSLNNNENVNLYGGFRNFDQRSCLTKRSIIILISSLTLIFLSFYYIVKLKFKERPKYDRFSILYLTWDLQILFYYEKYLFVIAFAFFITTISTFKAFSIFKAIPESKLFLLFGRTNIGYFCIMEAVVYIFFTIYDIELYFSYQNIFFMTLSLSVFTFSIGFFFVFLFELPIRKIVKVIRAEERLL